MKRAAFLLALLPTLALAQEWREIAVGAAHTWTVHLGSVQAQPLRGIVTVVAIVKRTDETAKTERDYLAGVPVAHCGATRGTLTLQPLDGSEGAAVTWEAGTNGTAAALAAGLCAEFKRRRT